MKRPHEFKTSAGGPVTIELDGIIVESITDCLALINAQKRQTHIKTSAWSGYLDEPYEHVRAVLAPDVPPIEEKPAFAWTAKRPPNNLTTASRAFADLILGALTSGAITPDGIPDIPGWSFEKIE